MMNAPLVSFVIPTYDCARYVADAIESALAQSHSPVEVVVVNDGSPDDTDGAVRPHLDRIRYIKQDNRGLSAARNVGFRASRGEFLCFLDADDAVVPEKIERQLTEFRRDPELGVVICGYMDVEEDGRTLIQTVEKHWNRDGLERLLRHEVFPPHSALIRREALTGSTLFPEDIVTAESQEDWQLWLELALGGVQFGSVAEPLCLYRSRPDSIRANPLKHNDGARRVVKWLRTHPAAASHSDDVEHLAATVEMERVAAAYRASCQSDMIKTLREAVRMWPRFWSQASTIRCLFERTLTTREEGRWRRQPDPRWFRKRVLDEIIIPACGALCAGNYGRVKTAACLAVSDAAYGAHDGATRLNAVASALVISPTTALAAPNRLSTIRGVLGPGIGRRLRAVVTPGRLSGSRS